MFNDLYIPWIKAGLAEELDKSQIGLAKALGVSAPQVSRMLGGKRDIKGYELHLIADYLGLSIPGTDQGRLKFIGRLAVVLDA